MAAQGPLNGDQNALESTFHPVADVIQKYIATTKYSEPASIRALSGTGGMIASVAKSDKSIRMTAEFISDLAEPRTAIPVKFQLQLRQFSEHW